MIRPKPRPSVPSWRPDFRPSTPQLRPPMRTQPLTIWDDVPGNPGAVVRLGTAATRRIGGIFTAMFWGDPLNSNEVLPPWVQLVGPDGRTVWEPSEIAPPDPISEVLRSVPGDIEHQIDLPEEVGLDLVSIPADSEVPYQPFLEVPPLPRADASLGAIAPAPAQPGRYVEVGLTVQPGATFSGPWVRGRRPPKVRARLKEPKELWRPKRDGKSRSALVYAGVQRLMSATFGAATEFQDFLEVVVANSYTAQGKPALLAVRRQVLAGLAPGESGSLAGLKVNAAIYRAIWDGLADGRFTLDLGGALVDYAGVQLNDRAIAAQGQAMQGLANQVGYRLPVGTEALINASRRAMERGEPQEGYQGAYVSQLLAPLADLASQRFTWSAQRGLSFQGL